MICVYLTDKIVNIVKYCKIVNIVLLYIFFVGSQRNVHTTLQRLAFFSSLSAAPLILQFMMEKI